MKNYKCKDGTNICGTFYNSYGQSKLPNGFKINKNCKINKLFRDCNEPEYERLSYCALNCTKKDKDGFCIGIIN